MRNELVGKQMVNFKNADGQVVEGVKLHFLCDDDRVNGRMAATQFIGVNHAMYDKAVAMPLGEFDFTYGMKGKIVNIDYLDIPVKK